MDDDTLRKVIRKTNFFHHHTHPYLPSGAKSLENPLAVFNAGIAFLKRCKELEPIEYDNRYKGTPFYWIGNAAFRAHDYETAVFFFDAAASEDIRERADPAAAPAFKFLLIQGDQPAQAAIELTQHLQAQMGIAIVDYNGRPDRPAKLPPLELPDIRTHFLQRLLASPQDRTLATAFISYFLEWHHRSGLAGLGIKSGSAEPFVLHLLKGCLLFESLLRSNPTQRQASSATLGDLLQTLHKDLAISPQRGDRMRQLGIDIDPRGIDFQTVMNLLATTDRSIATAVTLTELTRNKLGHRLDWEISFDKATFDSLASCVASSCLHAIASLYR